VLTLELTVKNESKDQAFDYEDCLHTYFEVGDIKDVSVKGLKGVSYLDKVDNMARKAEANDVIRIESEVDRTYLDTTGDIEIRDAKFGRVIRVKKENSTSTVVWNPWIAKAQQMSDFGNDEYHNMVCVESGNVGSNGIKLAPGKSSTLKVTLDSGPLS
jgi:D-hexose-6-phosphate mutarotase